MIEVHDSPELAKSDGEQALIPEIFGEPRAAICAPSPTAVGRSIVTGTLPLRFYQEAA